MSEEHQAYTTAICLQSTNTQCIRFHMFSERWFYSSLCSCRFIVGGEWLEGQLVHSRAPEIAIYLRTYLRTPGESLATRDYYSRGPHSSAGPPWTNGVHSCNQTQWFSAMAAKLVDKPFSFWVVYYTHSRKPVTHLWKESTQRSLTLVPLLCCGYRCT